MFKPVSTLAVYASEKERSVEFYTKILGFHVSCDLGPEACFLQSSDGRITIYLEAGMTPNTMDNQMVRLSFFLESDEPAMEIFGRLLHAGAEILQEIPEPVDDHIGWFQVLDPDGNIIEVTGTQ